MIDPATLLTANTQPQAAWQPPAQTLGGLLAYREKREPGWLDRMGHRVVTRWRSWMSPLKQLQARAQACQAQASEWMSLSDEALKAQLSELAAQCALANDASARQARDAALAAIVVAVVRLRAITPHTVQIMGAMSLQDGFIAEMATGEGKTLTAAMAALVAAMTGKPVHVVTANDYLARRDAEIFVDLFHFCGISVTHVDNETPLDARQAAYRHDVVYTTAQNLLGDYLRDHLALRGKISRSEVSVGRWRQEAQADSAAMSSAVVMRGLHQVIVDEADSVLIDEAVTPLIISSHHDNDSLAQAAKEAALLARQLEKDLDFKVNAALRHIELTSAGRERLKSLTSSLSAFWRSQMRARELVEQALYAMYLMNRDQHYVVKDDKVVLVDELTGRLADQRTLSQGLQQVLEATQDLPISPANQVSARMSFQRFFRRFPRMGGMTGTAQEARDELLGVYRLPTQAIPTHRPVQRSQWPLQILATRDAKLEAIVQSALALAAQGRAVLIGMRSVGSSEALYARFQANPLSPMDKIQLLHAVNHASESQIVAQAGKAHAITIATNMAGRGTDIQLDEAVKQKGGLHVLVGEINDLRRIDRQLYGRCARQGDPGSYQVFVCADDELFKRYLASSLLDFWRQQLRRTPSWQQHLVPWLIRLSQRKAERMNYRQRKGILTHDTQLDTTGF